MWSPIRFASVIALAMGLSAVLAIAALMSTLDPYPGDRLNYWLGVLSGSWFAPKLGAGGGFGQVWEFWVGALVALGLNLGSFILLFNVFAGMSFENRSRAMNLMQAFDVREADIKHELLKSVPVEDLDALEPIIDEAFTRGSKVWREQTLVALFGKARAEELLSQIEGTRLNGA